MLALSVLASLAARKSAPAQKALTGCEEGVTLPELNPNYSSTFLKLQQGVGRTLTNLPVQHRSVHTTRSTNLNIGTIFWRYLLYWVLPSAENDKGLRLILAWEHR